jgi:hypothetical protein
MEKKITLCEITEMRYTNEVDVMYNDGSVEAIFKYYPDELSFNEREFIGLTRDQALALFRSRDTAYLRS